MCIVLFRFLVVSDGFLIVTNEFLMVLIVPDGFLMVTGGFLMGS